MKKALVVFALMVFAVPAVAQNKEPQAPTYEATSK